MPRMNFDTLRPNKALGTYYRQRGTISHKEQLIRNLSSIKNRAKKQGIPFDIDINDILIPETCPVLGTPMKFRADRDGAPSFDKIDPSLGYVKGNVRIISHKANRWKNNMTLEDAKLLVLNWNKNSA